MALQLKVAVAVLVLCCALQALSIKAQQWPTEDYCDIRCDSDCLVAVGEDGSDPCDGEIGGGCDENCIPDCKAKCDPCFLACKKQYAKPTCQITCNDYAEACKKICYKGNAVCKVMCDAKGAECNLNPNSACDRAMRQCLNECGN